MNHLSRIIVAGLLLIAIFVTGSYIYLTHEVNVLKQKKYFHTSENMKGELQKLIKYKSESTLLIALGLSADHSIKNAIRKKHLKNIDFKGLTKGFQRYSSFHHVWLQLINADGKSFYRSWNDKKGDDLSSIRKDVKQMLLQPKVISTISTGKYDMTFKAMVPIFDNGKFIGIIEVITKFYSITKKMKNDDNDLLVVADKSYKKQLTQAYSKTFVDDYYIANPSQNKKLLHLVQKNSIEKYLKITSYMIDTKNALLVTTLQLADINGNPMGYFIIAKDLKKIDFSGVEQSKNATLRMIILILLLIIIFFYYVYYISYKRYMQRQNDLLESSVQEKTKELKLQKDTLAFIAHYDNLTGLANKVLLLNKIKETIKYAQTKGEQLSVFFLDLDKFKEVNDTYGNEIGDELLLQITARLKKCIKNDDILARLGGDEFGILHKNSTKISTINLIDTILIHMKKPFNVRNIEIFTSFSIGVAVYDEESLKENQLLINAETAMYKAKDDGKNTYKFYDKKMTELVLQRIQLDAEIRNALKNEEFVAYFQPKIDARNEKVIGLETLIRWNHPKKGIVLPEFFIPFCEETGLVAEIDKYMLIKSMQQIQKWKEEKIEFGKVSVNVSTKKIESSNYIDELSYIIESLQFDTSILELEILEGQIMKDPEKSIGILNAIRSLGISISIDDFGTGYSSLSYLKKLPVNKIKIDRSFVIDVAHNKEDASIVKTIILLAQSLGLETIAEGVETKEQLDFLVKEGCYNIQGYYFSKPLSADACKEFIIAHSKGK